MSTNNVTIISEEMSRVNSEINVQIEVSTPTMCLYNNVIASTICSAKTTEGRIVIEQPCHCWSWKEWIIRRRKIQEMCDNGSLLILVKKKRDYLDIYI